MVVYGQDCLDEISMSARTTVCEIKDGIFRSYEIEPEQFGFKNVVRKNLSVEAQKKMQRLLWQF